MIALKPRMLLYAQDRIVTNVRGSARITMRGCVATVGPFSIYSVINGCGGSSSLMKAALQVPVAPESAVPGAGTGAAGGAAGAGTASGAGVGAGVGAGAAGVSGAGLGVAGAVAGTVGIGSAGLIAGAVALSVAATTVAGNKNNDSAPLSP